MAGAPYPVYWDQATKTKALDRPLRENWENSKNWKKNKFMHDDKKRSKNSKNNKTIKSKTVTNKYNFYIGGGNGNPFCIII